MMIAHKLDIDRLLIIAGPRGAGKSTLIALLLENKIPALAQRLNLGDLSAWTTTTARSLAKLTDRTVRRLILHYNIVRSFSTEQNGREGDEVVRLVDNAHQVTFVTVWCPPAILVRQFTQSGKADRNPRSVELLDVYRNPGQVVALYRRWFAYTSTRAADHIVVAVRNEGGFCFVEEWERLAQP